MGSLKDKQSDLMGTLKGSFWGPMGSVAETGGADGGIAGHFHIIQGDIFSAVLSKLNALASAVAMPDLLF